MFPCSAPLLNLLSGTIMLYQIAKCSITLIAFLEFLFFLFNLNVLPTKRVSVGQLCWTKRNVTLTLP